MNIYEGHMGSLYVSDELLGWKDLYCETCGDSDWLLGDAITKEDAWEVLKENTDIDGSGGWDYDYVWEFINKHFPLTEEDIRKGDE